jgi:hypothetical protein
MPSCPVCGNNVPAGTQYCPACGTNLQQNFGQAAATNPTQSQPYQQNPQNYPSYSYPQQGEMGMPGPQKPRTRRLWVIVALLIGLLIGGVAGFFIGFDQPVFDYATAYGTVSLNRQYHGTAYLITFNSTSGNGNLTSVVTANSSCSALAVPVPCYLINLPVTDTYNVSIQWFNTTVTPAGFGTCIASPSTFTPNNATVVQNFSC